MTTTRRRLAIGLGFLLVLAAAAYLSLGFFLSRALEARGVRKLLAAKTAKVLDADAGYLPLTSHGRSVSSLGFLAKASPPRALTEMRASRLHAHCSLSELWRAKWKIDHLTVAHLQVAYGEAAAKNLDRSEFVDPELAAPSKTESPLELDIHVLDVAHLDLFWGTTPEAGGAFRDVHTQFYPRDKNLVVQAAGGTFQQAKLPVAQIEQLKLFYAKPDLRVDEGTLTFGGKGKLSVVGLARFEGEQSFDLQLTFAQCPIAPFLDENARDKLEGQFDGTTHLQKDKTQIESARATGALTISKAMLKNIDALKKVAAFTGRKELAEMPIQQIKGDYDWNSPLLTVKNFILESSQLVVVQGEFTMKDQKINGEFQLGVAPDLVEKFPGAREEVFKRSERGYLWTDLSVTGTAGHLRDNLRPRLVRAAQNHFAKGMLAPLFKPGQTVIEAIEAL